VLRDEVGECLTASIGLAPNRFLAKVASDMQKPDGLTALTLADLPHRLLPLKLRDFPGIGARMEQRLLRHGVGSTERLLALSAPEMRQIWGGVGGERFHAWLRGQETQAEESQQKSIGHSHVLPPELRNAAGAWRVLQKLVIKAAYRLRKDELWAKRIDVYVRFAADQESWGEGTGVFETQDTFSFLRLVSELWEKCPLSEGRPYQVGVVLSGLVADGFHTPSFFDDPRRIGVSRSVDRLNAKFGSGTVYFGSQHVGKTSEEQGKQAPLRIAFTRIPDLDEFS